MSPLYRRGTRDAAVAELRARLAKIGFSVESDEPDYFCDRMDEAVRSFQQARGINIDGIIGPDTLRRLEEAGWKLGDRPLQFTPGHLIHGDDVVSLQQRLNSMGFDAGKVDGIFGVRTDRALREFQKSVGENPDGIAASATFAALGRLTRTVSGGQSQLLRQSILLDSLRTGIAAKTIVIDPGHGGADVGEHDGDLSEADVVGAVAGRLQGKLAALGATVVLTRPLIHPSSPSDIERADLANDVAADLVISIHCHERDSSDAVGLSAFHFGSPGGGWSHSGERAAQRIHAAAIAATEAVDGGIHARTWEMLRLTRMPAVRIEIGSLSDAFDASHLSDPQYQERMAAGIAAGVVKFFQPAE